MASWILKAAVQKTISVLPNGHKVNYLFQKYATKKMLLDDAFMDQGLVHCSEHMRHLRAHCDNVNAVAGLELGTGWYPIVPLGMFLCGVQSITTVDVTPLLRAENLVSTIQKFGEYHAQGLLNDFLPDVQPDRLQALLSLSERLATLSVDEILRSLGITYVVADARHLAFPDNSIDFIHSNDVFEHIYPDVLRDILREFKRICKRGGLMSHFIDMSDHFSHFDEKIGSYHFLRFTDSQWKIIDNTIAPQSRLRLTEYRALYSQAGVPISCENWVHGTAVELRQVPLATRFKAMPESEVAVTHVFLISKFPD